MSKPEYLEVRTHTSTLVSRLYDVRSDFFRVNLPSNRLRLMRGYRFKGPEAGFSVLRVLIVFILTRQDSRVSEILQPHPSRSGWGE